MESGSLWVCMLHIRLSTFGSSRIALVRCMYTKICDRDHICSQTTNHLTGNMLRQQTLTTNCSMGSRLIIHAPKISSEPFTLLSEYRSEVSGCSASWIWMFHSWKLLWLPGVFRWVEIYTVRTGYYGVDYFFLLSGFGLSFSLSKERDLYYFYWKRVKTIYTPFIIIGVYHFGVLDWLKWIGCFSFYTHSRNDLLWYIPPQITPYVFFPLLFKLLDRSEESTALIMLFLGIWLLLSNFPRTTSLSNDCDCISYTFLVIQKQSPCFHIHNCVKLQERFLMHLTSEH